MLPQGRQMGGMLVEYRMRWESLLAALSAKQKP
jgi:hypothetical protein